MTSNSSGTIKRHHRASNFVKPQFSTFTYNKYASAGKLRLFSLYISVMPFNTFQQTRYLAPDFGRFNSQDSYVRSVRHDPCEFFFLVIHSNITFFYDYAEIAKVFALCIDLVPFYMLSEESKSCTTSTHQPEN